MYRPKRSEKPRHSKLLYSTKICALFRAVKEVAQRKQKQNKTVQIKRVDFKKSRNARELPPRSIDIYIYILGLRLFRGSSSSARRQIEYVNVECEYTSSLICLRLLPRDSCQSREIKKKKKKIKEKKTKERTTIEGARRRRDETEFELSRVTRGGRDALTERGRE